MDADRAMISKALQVGSMHMLMARGIEFRHFAETQSGKECGTLYEWATKHTRTYGVTPSPDLVRSNFPDWRPEVASDPIEALIDEFLDEVRRRTFQSKVIELAEVANDRSKRRRLDEIMLDAARDLASVIPSGSVTRMSEMASRVDNYVEEAARGYVPGMKMGIPLFDQVTMGIQEADVVTMAGYSGKGKSTLSQFVMMNIMDQDKVGLLLSLEMTSRQITERLDTMAMHFSHENLRSRSLPAEDVERWRRMAQGYAKASSDLIIVDRLSHCTIDRVYAEINRYKPDIACI